MRLNKYIARANGMSRRQADDAIAAGQIIVDGKPAVLGQPVDQDSEVKHAGELLKLQDYIYLLMDKPIDYVCSRREQGERKTIYTLLPKEYRDLKPAGRLDADSHGLILLTNDGDFAHQLTHPSFNKTKIYELKLDHELSPKHQEQIEQGVQLTDGISKLGVDRVDDHYLITMHEGRNRQIRRTFSELGYEITDLYRTHFGDYGIADLNEKVYSTTDKKIPK